METVENRMKFRIAIFIVLIVLVFLGSASLSSDKPDYSGTWVLDKNRSFSNPAGFDQQMSVTQKGEVLKLAGKHITPKGETVTDESYTLDGKEVDFTPTAGPPGAKGRRKSFWLADGRSFVVTDTITTESASGLATQEVIRKWRLSSDRATLTIDYHFDGPRGQGESKRVFVRKP
jgi:hypothetical protein